MPHGYGKLFARTDVNWAYESEPEPALGGRRVFTPRGKVLGGSSSINGLVHIRGQREDYDGWGVPGWAFADLLPYFKKSEDNDRGASEWHGAGGPLAVSDLPDAHELCDAFIASAMALGVPRIPDFNGASQAGPVNARRRSATAGDAARRSGTSPGGEPCEPARRRRGVATCALRRQARDRRWLRGARGARHEVRAAREVILSGGSFNSPQLLQLSGVGPRALLERHGIAVVHDAPRVGEDLQDHFYCRHVLALHPADHAERRHAHAVGPGQDRAAVPAVSPWPAHRQRGLRRGVRAHAAGGPPPRRADLLHQLLHRQARRRPASVLGLHPLGVADAGRVARVGADRRARPACGARDPLQLSRHRARSPGDGRRLEVRPAHRRYNAATRIHHCRGVPGPARTKATKTGSPFVARPATPCSIRRRLAEWEWTRAPSSTRGCG